MKKRVFTILLSFILLFTTLFVPVPAAAASGTITLRIHYHRPDGDAVAVNSHHPCQNEASGR